jgi:hypothetical protein
MLCAAAASTAGANGRAPDLGAGGTRLPTRLRGVGFFNAVLLACPQVELSSLPHRSALEMEPSSMRQRFSALMKPFSAASFRTLLFAL